MFLNPDFIVFLLTYHPPSTEEQRELHTKISDGSVLLRQQLTDIATGVAAGTIDSLSAFREVSRVTADYALAINTCVPSGVGDDVKEQLAIELAVFGHFKRALDLIEGARMMANRGIQQSQDPQVLGSSQPQSWRRYFAIAATQIEEAEMIMNAMIACYCAARELDVAANTEPEPAEDDPKAEPVQQVLPFGVLEEVVVSVDPAKPEESAPTDAILGLSESTQAELALAFETAPPSVGEVKPASAETAPPTPPTPTDREAGWQARLDGAPRVVPEGLFADEWLAGYDAALP